MIMWTGLAPWVFEFHFLGSLTSTLGRRCQPVREEMLGDIKRCWEGKEMVQGYLAHKKMPTPLGPP